jgi:hypothetical protein
VLPHNVCAGAINVDINPNEEPKTRRFIKKLGQVLAKAVIVCCLRKKFLTETRDIGYKCIKPKGIIAPEVHSSSRPEKVQCAICPKSHGMKTIASCSNCDRSVCVCQT